MFGKKKVPVVAKPEVTRQTRIMVTVTHNDLITPEGLVAWMQQNVLGWLMSPAIKVVSANIVEDNPGAQSPERGAA